MKKVCIVTNYKGTANYGAILQAYALNMYVRLQGLECQTLNYRVLRIDKKKFIRNNVRRPKVIADIVLLKILRKMAWNVQKLRRDVFDQFREECIPHTEECSRWEVGDVAKEFDVLLCGSDQIWRPSLQTGEFDDVMWLIPFPKSMRRISYGASLGVIEVDEKKEGYIRDALKNFQAISVREESAKKLLEQICKRKIQVVLDPVFLLDRDTWRKFEICSRRTGKYIFVYFIEPKKKIYRRIEKYARTENMEIVYMPYMGYKFNWSDFTLRGRRIAAATPQEFVGYIDSAAYVITDSFHATAFSVMLHKDFNVFLTNHGTRLQNLLNLAGLENRIANKDAPIHGSPVPDEIWERADSQINERRGRSIRFLKQIFL